PTAELVRSIVAGQLPRDVHITPPGNNQWYPLMAVQEVVAAITEAESSSPLGIARPPLSSAPPPAHPSSPPSPMASSSPSAVPLTASSHPPAAQSALSPPPFAQPPLPSAQPAPRDAAAAAQPLVTEPKPPKRAYLPYAIFGGFVFLAIIELVVAIAVAPK